MSARFVPNRNIGAELAGDFASYADRKLADLIVSRTKANARMRGYRNNLRAEPLRDGVRIIADFPFAHLEEWGSVNNSPRAPMRRALAALGFRIRDAR